MLPPTIPDQIRDARLDVEAGQKDAAEEVIREILASIDKMLADKWELPVPGLHLARNRFAKAGRAVLNSDFVLATTQIDEAIRALEKPAKESE